MSVPVSSLTPAQVAMMIAGDSLLRSAIIKLYQSFNTANAAIQQYNDGMVQIISTLDGAAPLPTSTGLAGASPFPIGDPGYLISDLTAFATWFTANIAGSGHVNLYVEAAGSVNLEGNS